MAILSKIIQYFCRHKWRPALQTIVTQVSFTKDNKLHTEETKQQQVKICLLCMKKTIITEEQMYAEFGIVNFIGK